MPATFQDFAAIKERMFFAANTSLKLETNEWQPAQELGNPAPQTTLGRWVEPGARCSGPSQPAQNLPKSGQTLRGIFSGRRTGHAV
jgi:hypothetical protein